MHKYSRTYLSVLNGTESYPDMQIIQITGFFFENSLQNAVRSGEKILQTAVLDYIFIYVQIKH